jgi:hypothetical protein
MAINWEILKRRYLSVSHATQLDILSLNLAGIQTLVESGSEGDGAAAKHLVRESQFFIEWIVPAMDLETDIDFAVELADLQRRLSHWKIDWSDHWDSEPNRLAIGKELQTWCDRLQQRNELLTPQAS